MVSLSQTQWPHNKNTNKTTYIQITIYTAPGNVYSNLQKQHNAKSVD